MLIEEEVITYLNGQLTVPVYAEVPERDIPEKYVLVHKSGTRCRNFLYSATFSLKSRAKSRFAAAELSQDVVAKMQDIPSLGRVTGVDLESEGDATNGKEYCYQAVFTIYHY